MILDGVICQQLGRLHLISSFLQDFDPAAIEHQEVRFEINHCENALQRFDFFVATVGFLGRASSVCEYSPNLRHE